MATAQDAAKTAGQTVESGNNQLAMLLAIVTFILAFVIWGMGRVLVEFGRQALEKSKASPKVLSVILLMGFSLLTQFSFAQDAGAASVKTVANYGSLSETTFEIFVTVIGMEVITILFLAFSIKRIYVELLPEKPKAAVKRTALSTWWAKLDK